MNVEIIKPFGYSKTLQNLLDICHEVRTLYPFNKVCLLGGLLNADSAKEKIKQLNIEIIDIPYQGFYDFVSNMDVNTILITSPYGTGDKVFKLLKKRKIVFYDSISPLITEKIKFINKCFPWKKVIFVGNVNTIEENYLVEKTYHKFYFYDLSNQVNMNSLVFNKKFNKESTQIIYQSEIADDSLTYALLTIKNYLPKANVNSEISDDNYDRKKNLNDVLKDGDVVLIVSNTKKSPKYILDYYHLSTKDILFSTIRSVEDAMNIQIEDDKNIYIISDGSIDSNVINNIYFFFKYKFVQGETHEQNSKVQTNYQ